MSLCFRAIQASPGRICRSLGLPLMVVVIGDEAANFRPLVDLYREVGSLAGFGPEQLKVGLHSLGYVGASNEKAVSDYYLRYVELWTSGKGKGMVSCKRREV